MIINYSHERLEELAEGLNKRYDKNRLFRPSQIDPYDLVDLIDARLAFDYISPDNSYLGATVFENMELPMWPEKPFYTGLLPEYKFFYKNTIIIDKDLAESEEEQNRFKFCFTVIHECFHLCRHRYFFQKGSHYSSNGYKKYGENDYPSELDKIEAQANFAAAAFLMPKDVVFRQAKRMLHYRNKTIQFGFHIKEDIKEMGKKFGVNYTPMVYRLQNLGILDEFFDSSIK